MERFEWENQIIDAVADRLEIARGDAQDIVEGQDFIMAQAWGMDLAPAEVAQRIINA